MTKTAIVKSWQLNNTAAFLDLTEIARFVGCNRSTAKKLMEGVNGLHMGTAGGGVVPRTPYIKYHIGDVADRMLEHSSNKAP